MIKVLVIGDVMLDKHVRGEVRRISPEAPVPVINVISEPEITIGAAGYVAAQIAEAGIEVALCYKGYEVNIDIQQMLSDSSVMCCPLYGSHSRRINTIKTRVWTEGQQICRIDEEDITKPSTEVEEKWIKQISRDIIYEKYHLVVFSDYDKGTLTDHIIQSIANVCHENNIPTILDPKRYSYFGLQNLFLIKPNQNEIKITNMKESDVSAELGNTYLLSTHGQKGMSLFKNGSYIHSVDAIESKVVDVCGAGDITTAFLAISLVSKQDYRPENVERAMKHATVAASTAIEQEGCYIIHHDEIIEMILRYK